MLPHLPSLPTPFTDGYCGLAGDYCCTFTCFYISLCELLTLHSTFVLKHREHKQTFIPLRLLCGPCLFVFHFIDSSNTHIHTHNSPDYVCFVQVMSLFPFM